MVNKVRFFSFPPLLDLLTAVATVETLPHSALLGLSFLYTVERLHELVRAFVEAQVGREGNGQIAN
jgi:hypothetical protein